MKKNNKGILLSLFLILLFAAEGMAQDDATPGAKLIEKLNPLQIFKPLTKKKNLRVYDMEFYLSPKLKEKYVIYPSMEIDIVGASDAEKAALKQLSIEDYFSPSKPFRNNFEHYTVKFSNQDTERKVLSRKDSIFKSFQKMGVKELYLFVNLPPVQESKEAKDSKEKKEEAKDLRKIVVPVKKGRIVDSNKYFIITPMGIVRMGSRPN